MKVIRPPFVKLLTTKQYKLNKGLRLKWATSGIGLAPGNTAKLGTVCASAGICEAIDCLAGAGHNGMPTHRAARYRRTLLFRRFTSQFFQQADAEITLWKIRMTAQGLRVAVRPNLLSDLPTMAQDLARRHPDVQFYDYSKHSRCYSRTLPNYHLTYSYSERTTAQDIADCVAHKTNIAVVFATKRGAKLPKVVTLHGVALPVIDGDVSDLRFLDKSDRAYVVGLRWKHTKDSAQKLRRAIAAGYVIEPQADELRRAA
jgi:hypothetical protein